MRRRTDSQEAIQPDSVSYAPLVAPWSRRAGTGPPAPRDRSAGSLVGLHAQEARDPDHCRSLSAIVATQMPSFVDGLRPRTR